MKIALISLPFWPDFNPPLGLAYISSVLREMDHDVKVFDKNIELCRKYAHTQPNPWNEDLLNKNNDIEFFQNICLPLIKTDIKKFTNELIHEGYEAIGFSVTQLSRHASFFMASILKKICPSLLIFIGGPDISSKEEWVIHSVDTGIVDIAFEAEAEGSVKEFFESYVKNEEFDGIVGTITRSNKNRSIRNKKRPAIDYKNLPYPDFRDFPLSDYKFEQLPIMMSRGCVATCSFCTEYLTWKSYRVRTGEDVALEIKNHIKKYQINKFTFCDSLINGNFEQLKNFVENINDVEITWDAFCRVDKLLTKELLYKMYLSGCRELKIGFESDSQKVLDLMNKGTKVEENIRVLNDAYDIGIKVHGLFLLGFPGESNEDFLKTLRFIHNNLKKFYVISIGQTLDISGMSAIGLRPKRYNIKVDSNGKPVLDSNHEWTSADGTLTPKIRLGRLRKMRDYLDSQEAKWVPKVSLDLNIFQRFTRKIYLAVLKRYYMRVLSKPR